MASLFLDHLVRGVAETVQPQGFKRSGNHLRRETAEALQFISFQSSQSSTADALKVTVNIGCELKKLHGWVRSGRKIKAAYDCLWNVRLGHFADPPGDRWWIVSDPDSLANARREVESLLPRAIKRMEELSTEEGVRQAFGRGELPGKTFQELREFIDRPEGSEYWPGWDMPLKDN